MTATDDEPRGGEVLVLFPGALGDAVCFEPAFRHLATLGPVTLYARGGAAEVAALFPSRPLVRSLDAPEVARLFARTGEAEDETAAWLAPYARIVSFTGAGVVPVAARLAATGRAVLARFPRPPLLVHAADLFLRVVTGDPHATAGPPRLIAPDLDEPVTDRPAHGQEEEDSPLLVLLPGSGGAGKRAPRASHSLLADRWCDAGGQVRVVLGPAEAGEEGAWASIGAVVRPPSVADLAHALATARAFAGNDAGPSHVAAALGVAGVVLYMMTEPGAFGPRGDGVTSIVASASASDDLVERAWQALRRHLP